MKKYIDFDTPEMPIPFKYEKIMVFQLNKFDKIPSDVINRLNFLLEVRPSYAYSQLVTSPLNVVLDDRSNGIGLADLTYAEQDADTASRASIDAALCIKKMNQES